MRKKSQEHFKPVQFSILCESQEVPFMKRVHFPKSSHIGKKFGNEYVITELVVTRHKVSFDLKKIEICHV